MLISCCDSKEIVNLSMSVNCCWKSLFTCFWSSCSRGFIVSGLNTQHKSDDFFFTTMHQLNLGSKCPGIFGLEISDAKLSILFFSFILLEFFLFIKFKFAWKRAILNYVMLWLGRMKIYSLDVRNLDFYQMIRKILKNIFWIFTYIVFIHLTIKTFIIIITTNTNTKPPPHDTKAFVVDLWYP